MSIISHHELEYIMHRYGALFIIVLACLAFLSPLVIRIVQNSPITPGSQSYEELIHANAFTQGKELPTMYGAVLGIMIIFGVPWLLPSLLAGIFLILLGLFMSSHLKSRTIVIVALAAIVISPTMSVLATAHTPIILASIFIVAALLLQKKIPLLSGFIIMLAALTIPIFGIIACIALVLLDDAWHRRAIYVIMLVAGMALCIFISHPTLSELYLKQMNANIFFELGAVGGISIFFVILAGYGLLMGVYGSRIKMSLALVFFAVMAVLFPSTLILFTAILSLLFSYATMQLLMTDWQLGMLQESLLIIVVCIVLFILITAGKERVQEMPNGELEHALIALHTSQRIGGVLTAPEYAPLVEYFSGRNPLLQPGNSTELLTSSDSKQSYPVFEHEHLAYVVISDEMQGTILPRSDSGVMFLLQHSGRFIKISETRAITTWYFIQLNNQ